MLSLFALYSPRASPKQNHESIRANPLYPPVTLPFYRKYIMPSGGSSRSMKPRPAEVAAEAKKHYFPIIKNSPEWSTFSFLYPDPLSQMRFLDPPLSVDPPQFCRILAPEPSCHRRPRLHHYGVETKKLKTRVLKLAKRLTLYRRPVWRPGRYCTAMGSSVGRLGPRHLCGQ